MSRGRWLTPDSIPAETVTITINCPDSVALKGCLHGALLLLTDPANWEQYGEVTPEDIAYSWLLTIKEAMDNV